MRKIQCIFFDPVSHFFTKQIKLISLITLLLLSHNKNQGFIIFFLSGYFGLISSAYFKRSREVLRFLLFLGKLGFSSSLFSFINVHTFLTRDPKIKFFYGIKLKSTINRVTSIVNIKIIKISDF